MFSSILELPETVRKLPETKQRAWLAAFNGSEKSGKSEVKSVAIANGVIKSGLADKIDGEAWAATLPTTEALPGEIELAIKEYQYVDSYEYESCKVSQEEAVYNPVGGDSTAACANCRFFISPARCAVVSGTISPTGVSALWRAVTPYVQEPTPVRVVKQTTTELSSSNGLAAGGFDDTALGEKPSLIERGAKAVARFLGVKEAVKPPTPITEGLIIVKQTDGTYRWLARYSNSWEDRDREILTEASQKAFVELADQTQVYPELWLWHTPGTKWGQADWLDFADGFAFASGTVDKGKEYIADALVNMDIPIGVSHGFLSVNEGNYITKHFTFEISPLPLERAAVWTTDFNVITKEKDVSLTAEKRTFLASLIGEDGVKNIEANTAKASKELQELNIAYKSAQEAAAPASPAPAAAAGGEVLEAVKALGEQFVELSNIVSGLAGVVAATQKSVAQVTKSDDEKQEEAFLARVAKAASGGGVGVRASASDSTLMPTDEAKKVEKELSDKGTGDFFTDRISKDIFGPGVSFAGAAAVVPGGIGAAG